jgi:hypothetical protein
VDPDDLYGLPLDRFVPERGALAKELRAAGRRDEATQIAGMRKPSVAAWAVNQVVRTQGRAVKALFDAGDALRDAQAELLAGSGDARSLRAARERERSAVDRLVQAARGLLTSDGHDLSASVVDRVGDTLHAAALDEDAREQVCEGRLERELQHVGFGLGEGAAVAPAAPPATKAKGKARAKAASPPKPSAAERAEAKRAAERERKAARKAARAAESEARRRVKSAARALQDADQRRDRAAQALADADAALAAARKEAEVAERDHRRAQSDLKNA